MQKNSKEYIKKKSFYDHILTVYGRNTVYEFLLNDTVKIHRLHLSNTNRIEGKISKIMALAKKRNIDIYHHEKGQLSRISKNAKQDQGVALDIIRTQPTNEQDFLQRIGNNYKIVILDGVTNPQNLGMAIRSCAAGNVDAIILPSKNSAKISPLVIKASAGTIFKIPIIQSNNLLKTLAYFKSDGAIIYSFNSHSKKEFKKISYNEKSIFILGNETDGISRSIEEYSDVSVFIPMNNDVESLNVAMTATIISFTDFD